MKTNTVQQEQQPSESLRLIYNKYSHHYKDEAGKVLLQEMIRQSVSIGENACSLFEEHANSFLDPTVSADDLQTLFKEGLGYYGYPSIRSLIEGHLKGYRHILELRVALTRDCVMPIVSVQYILVWKEEKKKNALLIGHI